MAKKKQIPELKVLFDTNVLYTQVASDLVRHEISALINEHSNYVDHQISWYLPEVVRHERQYQMQKSAHSLLPSVQKLEKLLGHNLGFNQDILNQRVAETINSQLKTLNIKIASLDTNKIKWDELIQRSVYRHPPFEAGEKEKGFRDSLVVETLRQIVEVSPSTPSVCRIVLVSEDELVRKAALTATKDSSNVRVLARTEELIGLINTLVSEVGEDFVAELVPKAQALFFVKDEQTSLYYKEELQKRIKAEFPSELAKLPPTVVETEATTWYIGPPRFVRKDKQRIYWTSRIQPTFKGFRYDQVVPSTPSAENSAAQSSAAFLSLAATVLGSTTKAYVCRFSNNFEVDWSVTLGQHKKFSGPKIDGIRFTEQFILANED